MSLQSEVTPANITGFLWLGMLFTFVIMFLDERVQPELKDWWFMEG